MRAVFVVAPGVHLLDLAGPAQVFTTASELLDDPWRPVYVAETPRVTAHQGVTVGAETAWPTLAPEDLVVVPGWQTDGEPLRPRFGPETLDRIAGHHARGGTVMSVCAGAFVLAQSGLLDGRRATTHHRLQDVLADAHPRVRVVRDVLYVGEERLYTSAGIASGIDLALHVVDGCFGPQAASRVARAMVVYARRNGQEPQHSVLLRYRDHVSELVHRVQDIIEERYREQLPLALLADELNVSERTITRAFSRATGLTPLRYQQALRREHAELLLASGASVERAALEAGFDDGRMLRRLRRAAG